MDTESPNVYQVLSNLQLKIAFLFQDLIREGNTHKQNSENLSIKLEQLSAETENIKKENKALRKICDELKNVFSDGVRVFSSWDFSSLNLKSELEIELENLKKNWLDTTRKLETFESGDVGITFNVEKCLEETGKISQPNIKRYNVNEEEIQKEYESIKDLNFSTEFFQDVEADGKLHVTEKECGLNRSNSNSVLTNLFERKSQNSCSEIVKLKNHSPSHENKTFSPEYGDASCSKSVEPSSEESTNRSPVFKDFVNRKQDGLPSKEKDKNNPRSSPLMMINETVIEKSKNFIISPWKKSSHPNESTLTIGSSTPKRARKKLKIISPKRSPNAQLKKSNSREAEISISGVRKLTQTLLNVECYKRKNPDERKTLEKRQNEDFESPKGIKNEKRTIDLEEDDFITESPKKTDQILEDIKNRMKNDNVLNNVQLITPPETSDADLDETFISASIIRKSKITEKHLLQTVIEEKTPVKRPAREKSPEYDSVPFLYKRDPVRKKAERMKLPGHACLECNKYYENAFGDIDTENLKKILNKCSRHRDKNSPIHEETPPGYWKPYLTCSIMMSPKEDV